MNYEVRWVSVGLLGIAAACVLSEPIGETPLESSSGDATGSTASGSTTRGEDSSTGGPSTGNEDTGGVSTGLFPGDTEASTGIDTEGPGGTRVCSGVREDNFSWQWSFGSYQPEIDDEDLTYEADASVPLECDVLGFSVDRARDELLLDLDCEADGIPIEDQDLSLSPIPQGVVSDLQAGEAFSVFFRPEVECPNGCNIGDNGWLSIRRESDDQVVVAIVDVHRLLPPVDELAPLAVTATDSSCSRVFDVDSDCATPGWVEELDVVIEIPNDTVTVTGSGQMSGVNHRIFVNQAVTGVYDRCTADGGDRAQIELMIVWVFVIK